jgi:hypothetical protein
VIVKLEKYQQVSYSQDLNLMVEVESQKPKCQSNGVIAATAIGSMGYMFLEDSYKDSTYTIMSA